jgi:hypothetical protein
MKKFGFSLALCAALSFVAIPVMTTSADAAGKKKPKAAKVEVSKKSSGPAPASVVYFNSCASTGASYGVVVGSVSAVGCGLFWAVPVLVQSFIWRG